MQLDTTQELFEFVEHLKRTEIRNQVDRRVREFEETGEKSSREIFKELCFCIMCANFSAERSIKIQTAIGDGFSSLPESKLLEKLKALGHRFPNTRARYIVEARKYQDSLKEMITSFNEADDLREWLIKNVKGIGRKEASHFLRNIGYPGLAILDFHVLDVLTRRGLIEKPKTLTRRRYLEIEGLLRKLARKAGLSLAELDLFLWYMETGKVLK